MAGFFHSLFGYLKLEVYGADLNRFLNLCASENILFWGHHRISVDRMTLFIPVRAFYRMPHIARRCFCRVHILKRFGLPFLIHKIKPRTALILGVCLFLLCAWVSSLFLWEITISGPTEIPHARIRHTLSEHGVSPGAYTKSLDLEHIKNQILLEMPDLIYLGINLHGSHAEVIVRDRTRPPSIVDETGFANIVATQGGVIERVVVYEGTPEVKKGDLVTPGQILANGYMTGRSGVTVSTRARADVYARTWDQTQAIFPLSVSERYPTGEKRTRFTLIFGRQRIKIFEKGSIHDSECDKIVKTSRLVLPGGIALPIALEQETAHECRLQATSLAPISAIDLVANAMQKQLSLSSTDSLIDCRFTAEESGGALIMKMTAECIKQIGMEQLPKGE